jgi:hypothetical protein
MIRLGLLTFAIVFVAGGLAGATVLLIAFASGQQESSAPSRAQQPAPHGDEVALRAQPDRPGEDGAPAPDADGPPESAPWEDDFAVRAGSKSPSRTPGGHATRRRRPEEQGARPAPSEGQHLPARKSEKSQPIEIIWTFLGVRRAAGEVFHIQVYSDLIATTFEDRDAVVVRVIYEVRGRGIVIVRDQLFLIQDEEVVQWVDFEVWLAHFQTTLAALAARQRGADRAHAARRARQWAARQAFATRLSQKPGNHWRRR